MMWLLALLGFALGAAAASAGPPFPPPPPRCPTITSHPPSAPTENPELPVPRYNYRGSPWKFQFDSSFWPTSPPFLNTPPCLSARPSTGRVGRRRRRPRPSPTPRSIPVTAPGFGAGKESCETGLFSGPILPYEREKLLRAIEEQRKQRNAALAEAPALVDPAIRALRARPGAGLG